MVEEKHLEDSEKEEKKFKIKDLSKFKPKSITKEGKNITISLSASNIIIALLVIALAASILTGGFGFGSNNSTGNTAAVPNAPSAPQPSQEAAPAPPERVFVSTDDDPVLGEEDAPVTIIEFSDFQCPFCKRFKDQTFDQIKEEYIDAGKAKLIYRDLPLGFHQNAQKAAEAAECAHEQGKFWEYHDTIFENQNAITVDDLKTYASDLGLNTDDFNDCLDSDKYKDETSKDSADANAAGATGTPSFFIGNDKDGYIKVVGAQPFATFQATIDAELA